MADDNFLMQFGIDIAVTNAAPTQRQIDQITNSLNSLGSAAKSLKAATEVEEFFKAVAAAARSGSAAAQRMAAALKEVAAVKADATKQIKDQEALQRSFQHTSNTALVAARSLDVIAKARTFQGMKGMAEKLSADGARIRAFRTELSAAHKAGADLSTLKVPTTFLKGGNPALQAAIAQAEAGAGTEAERRLAVYQVINKAILEQARLLARLSVSPEVAAANRLAAAFSNVVREVKAASAEMSVLIDRSRRVRVPTDTGALVNSRVLGAQTVLGSMKQDPGTAANFQLQQQKARSLAADLENATRAAEDAQRAMLELSSIKLDLGQKAMSEQIAAAAKSLQSLRDELKATAESGQLLNLKNVKLPTLTQNPAAAQAMQAELAAAANSAAKPATIAAKQYEIINRYLTEEIRLLNEANAAGSRQVETARLTADAMRRANGIHGNFYPLIVSAGLFAGLSRAVLGFAGASIKGAADYEQAFASVARTTQTKGHDAELQIDAIRKALIDLSTDLPTSFQDLSKVATAGNQLGIAAQNIPQFTKTVSEFAAITGDTADSTAKSFGSLIQILHLSQNEYNNLASSVTLVGRKSVATESEVLAMTTRIGAIAHSAGFSAQETVGLAAAFSSLREPVERSQGALTTYTKVVDKAAAEGGPKFQKFADVLGVTADRAQKLLRTNPYQFFQQFLTGLSKLDGIGKTNTLGDLGLGNIRVSETLGRLSSNLDVLKSTQADADAGFKSGTDLTQQYAKATDTLVAKFTELQNAVSNLFAAIGGNNDFTRVLGSLVTLLKNAVVGLTDFVGKNPQLATFAVAMSAIVGVLALVRGGMIAVAIASFALDSAMERVTATSTLGGLGKLAALMFNVRTTTVATTVATEAQTVAQGELAGATNGTAVALSRGAVAAGIFKSALVATGIGVAIAAIGSLIAAVQQYNDSIGTSFNKDDLSAALQKDTDAWQKGGTALRLIQGQYPQTATAADGYKKTIENVTGATVDLTAKTAASTEEMKKHAVAFGAASEAAVRSDLGNNEAFQKLFQPGQNRNNGGSIKTLESELGFDPKQFADKLATEGAAAAKAYVNGFKSKANFSQFLDNQDALQTLNDITDQYAEKERVAAGIVAEHVALQEKAAATAGNLATNTSLLAQVMENEGEGAQVAASAVNDLSNSFEINAATAARAATAQQVFAAQANAITASVFGGVNAYFAQSSALEQLGQDYVNNGAAAAFAGQGLQSYVAATVQGSRNGAQAADTLQALVNAMVAGGYVSGAYAVQLAYLNDEIARLGGSSNKARANIDFFRVGIGKAVASQAQATGGNKAMANSSNKAADALDKQAEAAQKAADRAHELAQKAQDAAAAFRTTADYANDLGAVLQRAFDIQFGPQQARDQIASTFNDMRKNAADAAGKIKDARAQIQGINADMAALRADNVQQNYFLGIANAFGDRVGAASIQAKIGQNNKDLADKQSSKSSSYKDISDAYAQLDTATVGNSDAAIKNRAALTGLVANYQDLITKLAASGLNQKQLAIEVEKARRNFIEQGTALGFSKRQLEPYSRAMVGFIEIIKKVPRKVTVEVKSNVSAAQNTLNEFYAKLKLDNAAKAAEAAAKFKDNYVKGIQKAAQDARKKANAELANIGKGVVPYKIPGIGSPAPNSSQGLQQASLETLLYRYQKEERDKAKRGLFSDALDTEIKRITNALADHQFQFTGFSSGGYTGPGGKYEPAGLVHKGEYVVPKHLVNQQTGLPFSDALGRLMAGTRPQAGYAGGGFVNPEMMVVEPGPKFMRKLQEIVQTEVSAVIEPRAIAGANQDYTTQQRRRGSNR